MTLDSQVQVLIDYYYSLNLPEFNKKTTAKDVRDFMMQFMKNASNINLPDLEGIKDHIVDTTYGKVCIRGFYPETDKILPPIIFFRGCGFVVDNFDDSNFFCAKLANACKTNVLAIDYPLAPEHPYPDSLEASYYALQWIVSKAELFNIDAHKIVIVGESSGACISASMMHLLKDRHGPKIGFQVLVYPLTNNDFNTESYRKMGKEYILSEAKLKWYLSQYLPKKKGVDLQYAFPMKAKNFSDLPKTLIVTAQHDPLCDDGKNYYEKLKAAKVPCEYLTYPDLIHGFLKFNGVTAAERAFIDITNKIKNFLKTK